jgi:tight adherence protein C
MIVVAALGIVLLAAAVALIASAVLEPRVRRGEYLSTIEAYSYTGRPEALPGLSREAQTRQRLDRLAATLGDFVAQKLLNVREDQIQRELVAAGFFRVGPRRFLGYRLIIAIVSGVVVLWLFSVSGKSAGVILVATVVATLFGWLVPNIYVHRRARLRLNRIDDKLPGMIDLLVVTLEAGIAFTGALRMASDRLGGPLGEELRLTIQEQALGLTTMEALENWLKRCDTPYVRGFVRAMVQGERLGVSIGQILRNQAVEMRARQKATVEERAQKAPIKILFPLVFLIFPAMFLIVLGPAILTISKNLHGTGA